MATVAELVRPGGEALSGINFIDWEKTYKDNNREFLRGDMWKLSFTQAPKIVYYPGDEILNGRLNAVNVGIDTSSNGITKRMRGGWDIYQQTSQNTNGTLSLQFVDREDQAITYWLDDWRQKIADRDTRYSFRKDDLVANVKLVLTNSSRITVRSLEFFNCVITDAQIDENGATESETDRADVVLSMKFEHYSRTFDNLT
jgi:hypothetical protein